MGEAKAKVRAGRVHTRAATPVAGAIAGILFGLIFATSYVLLATSFAEAEHDTGAWLQQGAPRLRIALTMLPFAGMFFLWFMAVVRERLGALEDQFFSTVFIGSGLLFLAMLFAAAAAAGALLATYGQDPSRFGGSITYTFARQTVAQIFGVFALRMAAIFVLSQATLWSRTGVMPRWMALLTYAVGLLLLVVMTHSMWVVLVFPAWVLLVSVYILVANLRPSRSSDALREPGPHLGI